MSKTNEPDYISKRYYGRYPSKSAGKGHHSSFKVYLRYTLANGASKNETIKLNEVDVINQKFVSNLINLEIARKNISDLVKRLNREIGVLKDIRVHNSDNERLLDAYWEAEYSHRDLKDKRAAYMELRRAINIIGNNSLLSASRSELQTIINIQLSGDKQIRVIEKINKLLKFCNRDIKLMKGRPDDKSIKYLTWNDLNKVLSQIDDENFSILVRVCFFTGMRLGEALSGSANRYIFDGDCPQVYVQRQLLEEKLDIKGQIMPSKLSSPKSKKRWAYIFEEGVEACKKWETVSKDFEMSHTTCSAKLKRATQKAFPNNPEKHVAFNGLRHSYAISLFEIGASMGYVAKSLGNTEKVCQKHYTGWEHTPDSMALLHTLAKKHKNKIK